VPRWLKTGRFQNQMVPGKNSSVPWWMNSGPNQKPKVPVGLFNVLAGLWKVKPIPEATPWTQMMGWNGRPRAGPPFVPVFPGIWAPLCVSIIRRALELMLPVWMGTLPFLGRMEGEQIKIEPP